MAGPASRIPGGLAAETHHRHRKGEHRTAHQGTGDDRGHVRDIRLFGLRARQRGVLRDQGSQRAIQRQGRTTHRQSCSHSIHADGASHPSRDR